MNRPARTLTRDLVRRRHPTGASPSRRIAPGRTLSPMPSEQKGAYGGDLALTSFAMEESASDRAIRDAGRGALERGPLGFSPWGDVSIGIRFTGIRADPPVVLDRSQGPSRTRTRARGGPADSCGSA